MSESLLALRHWDVPRLLLVASAFFAVGAVAFFFAVWVQLHGPNAAPSDPRPLPLTAEQKSQIVQNLNAENIIDTNDGVALPGTVQPPAAQADERDLDAAEKLKILDALNAQ